MIDLAYGQREIRVEVVNDGPAPVPGSAIVSPAWRAGKGHGLMGMRERVSAFGGTLDAGPAEDGGFRVLLRVPAGDGA